MNEDTKILHQDLVQINSDITDLKVQQGICNAHLGNYNQLLEKHIQRSEMLEERVDQIELPYKLICWVGVPLTAVVAVIEIIRFVIAMWPKK